jgi:hypothetical protein
MKLEIHYNNEQEMFAINGINNALLTGIC